MANLDKNIVPECEALHRTGTIKAIDSINRIMDVQIDETIYEDVPVHYHCMDDWKTHAHPHTASEQTQMLAAFKVDDQVLVLCDDDAKPLYVIGFLENPKPCAPIIVLFKQTGEEYDWWFWDLNENVGYHANPDVPFPSTPEIIDTSWACVELEEVEYYSRLTPALQNIATGGCADECGLINFDSGECCDSPQGADDDNDVWYLCPCGGEGQDDPYYGAVCKMAISCSGGCEPGSQTINFAGAKSTQARASNQSQNCPLGHSWQLVVGDLTEGMEIGPRSISNGSENSDVATLTGNDCSTQRVLFACMVFDPDECICTTWYNPQFVGYECSAGCSGWWLHANGYYHKWWFAAFGYGTTYQGCIDYGKEQKSGSYSIFSANVMTKIAVGEIETEFDGSWNQNTFNGTSAEGEFQHGWTTTCLTCADSGGLGEPEDKSEYTFAEVSYGIAGWRTVVVSDGRIAVLIPRLALAASAVSVDGNVTGNITSTTTALLRIVDATEYDFEIADKDQDYTLLSVPGSRDDLGIAPNCYPRGNLPYEIQLRGFHWHEGFDYIFAAFVMGGEFFAELVKKDDTAWVEESMAAFKAWVETMELEDYTMFLN